MSNPQFLIQQRLEGKHLNSVVSCLSSLISFVWFKYVNFCYRPVVVEEGVHNEEEIQNGEEIQNEKETDGGNRVNEEAVAESDSSSSVEGDDCEVIGYRL